tara:strand:+ start:6175 stop:6795 length:621 start_codon:yes stop_codon:yes gene_type:complete
MKHKIAKPTELCYQLIPVEWLAQLAFVFGKGARKHAPYDWEKSSSTMSYSDRLDSAMRHLEQFRSGISHDPETGAHNLGAAAWNCLCVYSLFVRGTGIDDRRTAILPESQCKAIQDETSSLTAGLKEQAVEAKPEPLSGIGNVKVEVGGVYLNGRGGRRVILRRERGDYVSACGWYYTPTGLLRGSEDHLTDSQHLVKDVTEVTDD